MYSPLYPHYNSIIFQFRSIYPTMVGFSYIPQGRDDLHISHRVTSWSLFYVAEVFFPQPGGWKRCAVPKAVQRLRECVDPRTHPERHSLLRICHAQNRGWTVSWRKFAGTCRWGVRCSCKLQSRWFTNTCTVYSNAVRHGLRQPICYAQMFHLTLSGMCQELFHTEHQIPAESRFHLF